MPYDKFLTANIGKNFGFGKSIRKFQSRAAKTYFSGKITPLVEYSLDARGEMTVENETAHLYRYWDATLFAEFLYSCVGETVQSDLRQEIRFLEIFDRIMQVVMEIVDMPDRRASLLIRTILQNRGRLSKNKREKEFPELTDCEIGQIESAISEISESVA